MIELTARRRESVRERINACNPSSSKLPVGLKIQHACSFECSTHHTILTHHLD